jgi:RHS repeat-associated protein
MSRTFQYDGENRQVTATINGTATTYGYDGNGLRISKTSGGVTTTYIYDAFGNLAAEYNGDSTSPCATTATCYVTWDHLGSTRMLTDANGAAQRRYDFLPFGQEILAGVDGRGSGYLSTPDDFGPKFTGQYRDAEASSTQASLDWFNVRHMSGGQGRFQSVDPANAGADLGDPQTWNGYSYVGNNPLSYTDPSGMGFWSWLFGATLDLGKLLFNIATFGQGNQIWRGNTLNLGGLTGCGGPLGNCGGLGSDPWSENPGLGSVQDPGRFVFDYNSVYHAYMTLSAGGSLGLAAGVVWVDFWPHSQGTDRAHTAWHAMGGGKGVADAVGAYNEGYQTCGEAYAGTVGALRAARGQPSLAVHIIQDSYSGSHGYQNWNGSLTLAHEQGDFAINAASANATDATRRYLQGLSGKAPLGSPESYLAPRPASCR